MRCGSGKMATGLSKQSEALPSAWRVEEPSNIQIGQSSRFPEKSSRTIVLLRMFCVGAYPSSQMYSSLDLVVMRTTPTQPAYESSEQIFSYFMAY